MTAPVGPSCLRAPCRHEASLVPEAPSISRATEAREAPHACRAPPVLTLPEAWLAQGETGWDSSGGLHHECHLGDAQRGTPVSCRRGDKAAAMASYTKQAKDREPSVSRHARTCHPRRCHPH